MYILHTAVLQTQSATAAAISSQPQPLRLPIHHLPEHYQQWGCLLELRAWLHGEHSGWLACAACINRYIPIPYLATHNPMPNVECSNVVTGAGC